MGNNLIRLMRRTPPTSAMSTTMVIATTTMQVILMAALRPISYGGHKCRLFSRATFLERRLFPSVKER